VTVTVHFLPDFSGIVKELSSTSFVIVFSPFAVAVTIVVKLEVGKVGIAARKSVSSDCAKSAAYSDGTALLSEKRLRIVPLSVMVLALGVSISSNKLLQEIMVTKQESKTAKKRENFNLRHIFAFIF
jgi:hypothetical protein